MKNANKTAAAALVALLAFAGPGVAAATEAQDRAEISELRWHYTRAIDTLNEDAYAAVFTPDGAFAGVKGRDALKKMVVDLKKAQADREAKGEAKAGAMYHVEGNEHLEFTDKDHARVHYYWMTVFAAPAGPPAAGPPATPRVAAVGHGVDDLVRVDGKWLIKFRDVAPAAPKD